MMPPFSDGLATTTDADARQRRPAAVGRKLAASASSATASDDGALVAGRKGCCPRLEPLHCGACFVGPGAYPLTVA